MKNEVDASRTSWRTGSTSTDATSGANWAVSDAEDSWASRVRCHSSRAARQRSTELDRDGRVGGRRRQKPGGGAQVGAGRGAPRRPRVRSMAAHRPASARHPPRRRPPRAPPRDQQARPAAVWRTPTPASAPAAMPTAPARRRPRSAAARRRTRPRRPRRLRDREHALASSELLAAGGVERESGAVALVEARRIRLEYRP